ncbi:hypothetical protein [Serpentinicella alkaliphila]|uniref:hypothetical protein n=1 Tax=Serpentinicella alkaliphila TaxID=1734049 RepID=UPI00104E2179|nr:hypothetical protein [Serpentinicella alkaliphila]QUH25211.1 hypothetical protein HZR23_05165 [Serpentinicella alkaliphila]
MKPANVTTGVILKAIMHLRRNKLTDASVLDLGSAVPIDYNLEKYIKTAIIPVTENRTISNGGFL